jgi:uncharacterized protein YqeY
MIREQLRKMSTDALKAGDKATRQRLSGVLAKFIEEEKTGQFQGWTEDKERDVVARYVKFLEGAIAEMGDRPLAADYRAEVALLKQFLPQMLDEAGTRALIEPLLGQCKGIGQLMGLVMKEHKGKVDAALVKRIAGEMGLK